MGKAPPQMSLYTRICVALFGIAGGIVVLFAADMTLNSGRFAAHALHAKTPNCSGTCHGPIDHRQDAARPATRMALPRLQTANRSDATQDGPRRCAVLGLSMETQGGD
jgi:hypothetical protein